jgi:hypothetical protein
MRKLAYSLAVFSTSAALLLGHSAAAAAQSSDDGPAMMDQGEMTADPNPTVVTPMTPDDQPMMQEQPDTGTMGSMGGDGMMTDGDQAH